MKFTKNDIMAVANSRVSRNMRKQMMTWAIILMLVMFLGIFVALRFNYVVGQILFYVPILAFIYGVFVIDNKQKKERKRLISEWEHSKYRAEE